MDSPTRDSAVVIPCVELQPTLDFFVELGFRLERISPADDPRTALISGHGLHVLLRRGDGEPSGPLVALAEEATGPIVPPARHELVVSRAADDAAWVTGRAGMHYRDLIPGRLGGRFIASHIRIPEGGPVADHVHFHAIRFQSIFCVKGWVRVVYEDQGPPFVLEAGDCVLQPPRIRHRVLESSAGLEVIELACPAAHDTHIDHELELPSGATRPDRDFGGQRFVRHQASGATWAPSPLGGFEQRDTGIADATGGLAGARVLRVSRMSPPSVELLHDGELRFLYVLAGGLEIEGATPEPLCLVTGDSVVLPPGVECALSGRTSDLELLEVHLPGGA